MSESLRNVKVLIQVGFVPEPGLCVTFVHVNVLVVAELSGNV